MATNDPYAKDSLRTRIARKLLGNGAAANAADAIKTRPRRVDDAVDSSVGNSPGQADRSGHNWDKSGTDKKSGRYGN